MLKETFTEPGASFVWQNLYCNVLMYCIVLYCIMYCIMYCIVFCIVCKALPILLNIVEIHLVEVRIKKFLCTAQSTQFQIYHSFGGT